MKSNLFKVFALLVIVVMALTACGPTATEEPAPTKAPEVAPTEAPPEPTTPPEPVATLKIWADDTRTPILQALADDFLAEYNVELVVEDLGSVQDIRSQVIIASAGR